MVIPLFPHFRRGISFLSNLFLMLFLSLSLFPCLSFFSPTAAFLFPSLIYPVAPFSPSSLYTTEDEEIVLKIRKSEIAFNGVHRVRTGRLYSSSSHDDKDERENQKPDQNIMNQVPFPLSQSFPLFNKKKMVMKSRASHLQSVFVTAGLSMIGIPTLLLNPSFTNAKEMSDEEKEKELAEENGDDNEGNKNKVFEYLDSIEKLNIKVPDFQKKLDWIGSQPLSFQKSGELKGKLVLLDFWTYCCINCMHILPSLKKFEDAYMSSDAFAVVGVHSPKFENEKAFDNVANAVSRYNITHPVVNDATMSMWSSIGVSSWPTLALVGPRGNLVSIWSGEGFEDRIMAFLGEAIKYYDKKGYLDKTPLQIDTTFASTGSSSTTSSALASSSPLSFPGRIIVNSNRGQLLISDSSNHRILVTDLNGQYIKSYGSNIGIGGLQDGNMDACLFQNPQGLTLYGDRYIYVADTDNHAIRRIDLDTNEVITVAGNGEQGFDYSGGKKGKQQYLSSPWDLVLWKEPESFSSLLSGDEKNKDRQVPNPDSNPPILLVAIAGTHQIWSVEGKKDGVAFCFSGTGRERELNTPDRINAAWAQPSGLALSEDKQRLYVADSESSSIRCMELSGKGSVRTLVGGSGKPEGTNLFAFGDKDGDGVGAKLQHPLAVGILSRQDTITMDTNPTASSNDILDMLLVADSYNQKVKLLTVKSGRQKSSIKTLAGIGGSKSISLSKNSNVNNKEINVDGSPKLDAFGNEITSKLSQTTFWEPSGLTQDTTTGLVYIADTNNNAIKVMDITKNSVFNLDLSTIPSVMGGTILTTTGTSTFTSASSSSSNADAINNSNNKPLLSKRRSRLVQSLLNEEPLSNRNGIINLQVQLPENTHFTDGVESRWQIQNKFGTIIKDSSTKGHIEVPLKDIKLATSTNSKDNVLELETAIYYCQEVNGNVCKVDGEVIQIKWANEPIGKNFKLQYTQNVPLTASKSKNQPSFQ